MSGAGDSAELFRVVNIREALEALISRLPEISLARESCGLEDALGRVLAVDVVSPEQVPPFARSTMDGYAVRARDTFGASEGSPAYLDLTGRVLMGETAARPVGPGEAVAIPTGGMLPEGADAVLMVEYTALADETTVEVVRAVGPGDNIVSAGEDIETGELLLRAGHRLRPQDLGALAALGIAEVEVYRPVRVGILSTGDEIVDVERQPVAGQVRDINYFALAGFVRQSGGEPVRLGICGDDLEALRRRLTEGLADCQVLITSGGSSVGAADLTPTVINQLGEPGVLVHGVSVKPGKPTIMALAGDVPIFGLPGHPVSCIDIYRLLVDPVIRYLYGGPAALESYRPQLTARISRNLSSAAGREDRVRVILQDRDGELWAEPVLGKSGLISLTVRSMGVAVIPFEAEGVASGEPVTVELF